MKKADQDNTPRLANWLLLKAVPVQLQEELAGDLREAFDNRIASHGRTFARFMYWVDTIHLLLGFSSLPALNRQNSTIMLGHYLTNFLRNFSKHKAYSAMTILGLVAGLGVCLAISQYIYFELSYDKFHNDYQQIYRVVVKEGNTDLQETSPFIGYSLGASARDEVVGIKEFVRVQRFNRGAVVINRANGVSFHEQANDLLFVDPAFLDVFNFPVRNGDRNSLFNDKFSVVITETTAQRYFGGDDPIGKTLKIDGSPSPGEYTVTGVLADVPLNCHLQFEFLIPIENYIEVGWGGAVRERGGWNGFSVVTYVTLEETADAGIVGEKLDGLIAAHNESDVMSNVVLQPVADVYMKSGSYTDPGFVNGAGSMQNIRIFATISVFVLLVAWANYINLSTAVSMLRAKEVGVRKSIGAFRTQLIR